MSGAGASGHAGRSLAPRSAGARLTGLLVFLALSAAVAVIGALSTVEGVAGWYLGLNKPAFTPPNWIFGPVWTALYAAIAVAGWRIWLRPQDAPGRNLGLTLYGLQMALNLLWSPLFFAVHAMVLALADIVLLIATVAASALVFRRLSPLAAWLLVPYLAWLSFATVLNFAVWRLN